MTEMRYQWRHGRFLLDCTPRPARDGLYRAQALVRSPSRDDAFTAQVPVEEHRFASPREAAMHALKAAVRWAASQR